jgi:pyruvate dehydrogenase E2 component (dihydrolipoamide acetyltransferase)
VADFNLPELGENVDAGDVVRILVKPGDTLKKEQPVLELETDKATIEVPSSVEGVVKELRVKQGDKVKVGQVILTVEEATAPPATPPGQDAAAPAEQAAAPDGKTPAPAPAQKAPATAAPSASVPPMEVEADEPAEDDQPAAARSTRVVDISRGGSRPAAAAPAASATGPAGIPVPAAPSTRRVARELGMDITEVPGSGPGGRISVADVKAHARAIITSGGARRARTPLPDFSQWGEVEVQPLRNIRRITAERLSEAWSTIPHVTQFDKADITALEEVRQKFGKRAEAAGGKLTVTAIALKVIASALKVFPQFNSSIDMTNNELILKKYTHIGVAVDTSRGLLVPVIRDVDRKNIAELSVELAALAEKAKAGKLTPGEMQGGCFSISNLGGIGGTYFTPIVNMPEVAILGISRSTTEPVFVDGSFQPRLMMPISLSYDHRVIDGADAIRFARWVCEALEQPFLLSLQG